jgi:hypothetical protein
VTRDEVQTVIDVLDARAAASNRIGVPERARGFTESSRMLAEALAKSEIPPVCQDCGMLESVCDGECE